MKYNIQYIDDIEDIKDIEYMENIALKQSKMYKKLQKDISKNKRMNIRNKRMIKENQRINSYYYDEEE